MIRELTDDEAAYRSLTLSWFEHSPLLEALRKLAEKKVRLDYNDGSRYDQGKRTLQNCWGPLLEYKPSL